MGNRAVITTKENMNHDGIGIYLHWSGGRDSVEAFLKYCELKGYRPPDRDNYGFARLCQVIANYFGGSTSIGIDTLWHLDLNNGDNGVYIIEGWNIVGRRYWDESWGEQDKYDLTGILLAIDESQPRKEQLGADFILASEVPTSELKIGDIIFVSRHDEKYEKRKVVGIKDGIPYVDLYDHDGDYSWNSNNYIRTETVRVYR